MELSGRNYNSKFKFIFILSSSGITLINSDCGDAASDRMETIFSFVLSSINFNLNQPTLCYSVRLEKGRWGWGSTIKWWWLYLHLSYHRVRWKVSSHSTDNILSLCSKLDCSRYQISNIKQWTWVFLSKWQVFSGKIPASSELCSVNIT